MEPRYMDGLKHTRHMSSRSPTRHYNAGPQTLRKVEEPQAKINKVPTQQVISITEVDAPPVAVNKTKAANRGISSEVGVYIPEDPDEDKTSQPTFKKASELLKASSKPGSRRGSVSRIANFCEKLLADKSLLQIQLGDANKENVAYATEGKGETHRADLILTVRSIAYASSSDDTLLLFFADAFGSPMYSAL
eukprot:Colp12_sorted_trinity150504_noHs@27224